MIIAARSQKDLIDQVLSLDEGIYVSLSITSYNTLAKFKEKQSDENEYYFLDGQGAVIVENLRSKRFKFKKLPGCELWLNLIGELDNQNIALIGAETVVNKKAKLILEEKYTNIKIPVSLHGHQKLNVDNISSQLKKNNVGYVFIALGQPTQEFLARDLLKKHSAIYMPIGGSFDILSGKLKRAPIAYRILMLEWLYRIMTKPNKFKNVSALIKGIYNAIYLRF